ncbi:DUF2291 family protein [Thalassobellus citreus]|uniref:DUF2291 family protein n=1 Tax=Thalassobellus citreus TaxID=3367752 RepID=UPI0037BC9890
MKKIIKYIILAVIVIVSLYNSVYFESLDKVKKGQEALVFNAEEYASDFMANKKEALPAINTSEFLLDAVKDVKSYAEQNGKKLGISNDYNFILDGNATVLSIEEENVIVQLNENNEQNIKIATDFIFGNAIRDGSALADIGTFQNTMDFNNISVELNNIVRETIVPSFVKTVKEGDAIYFKGATKINIKKPDLKELRVIPLILKINN